MEECSADVRRSIEGLDNFVMEGSRAFTTLGNVVTKMDHISKEESKLLTDGLQNAKRYLKSDLKVISFVIFEPYNR